MVRKAALDLLTAPIWVPTWVGVVVFRWLMQRDLAVSTAYEPDPLG